MDEAIILGQIAVAYMHLGDLENADRAFSRAVPLFDRNKAHGFTASLTSQAIAVFGPLFTAKSPDVIARWLVFGMKSVMALKDKNAIDALSFAYFQLYTCRDLETKQRLVRIWSNARIGDFRTHILDRFKGMENGITFKQRSRSFLRRLRDFLPW